MSAGSGGGLSLADELEATARARFVRWDGALWRQIVDGPAAELAAALHFVAAPRAGAEAVLASYLRLAAEAVGQGYLYPAAAGGQSFFGLAFTRLLPRGLPALPPERQAEALAACWNLAENLERSPAWLRRIFLRRAEGLERLDGLEALVADVERTLAEPTAKLLGVPRVVWVHLGDEDRRFLPGAVHFVAPTVACVHDRHGGRTASLGVWLADPPLPLGPMGCAEKIAAEKPEAPLDLGDLRVTEWHASARNAWRGAITLETSQFLVALLPPAP